MSLPARQSLLFIGSKFFGYEVEICSRLESLGWQVDFVSDCPPNKLLFKLLKNLSPLATRIWCDRYYAKTIAPLANNKYDKVFMLKGEGITRRTALLLRKSFLNAAFSLYLWDSIDNLPFGREKLDVFDRVMSFDPNDAAASAQIQLYPLFFIDSPAESESINQAQDIDLIFIGTARFDRYQFVKRIRESLSKNTSVYFRFFVQSKIIFEIGKWLPKGYKGAMPEEFIFKPIAKADVAKLMSRARVVIDMEHANQAGLTMRTIEAIGARKKLVTTNFRVREYDFYHPSNICVVDRKSPQIPSGFIESPYDASTIEMTQKYALTNWIDRVILG